MKRPRFALLAGCCAFVAACGSENAPPGAEPPTPWIPAELVAVHEPDLELAGTWRAEWTPGLDSTEIDVEPAAGGGHLVRVRREPDYGTSFHYETSGAWHDGGLWFAGADVNANGAVLYPARIAGEERLVPSGSLADVAAGELQRTFRLVRRRSPGPPYRPSGEELSAMQEAILRGYLPGPEDENDPWWEDASLPGVPPALEDYEFPSRFERAAEGE